MIGLHYQLHQHVAILHNISLHRSSWTLVKRNCSCCSLNSIYPMVLSPLPEILYYYKTRCFLGLRDANYNDWIRIDGELSYCLIRTYISTGRILAKLNIGCVKIKTCIIVFTVQLGSRHFAHVYYLYIGLYRLRSPEQRFERNSRYLFQFFSFIT